MPQPQHDAWLEGMPPSNAQFFYSSPIPIDDPLSAATGDAKVLKQPLRPFSHSDNNALERAWLQLSSYEDRENHAAAKHKRVPAASIAKSNEEILAVLARHLAARHQLKHAQENAPTSDVVTTVRATLQGASTTIPVCCEQLPADAAALLSTLLCPLALVCQSSLSVDKVVQKVMVTLGRVKKASSQPNSQLEPFVAPESVASSAASKRGFPTPLRFSALSPAKSTSIGEARDSQAQLVPQARPMAAQQVPRLPSPLPSSPSADAASVSPVDPAAVPLPVQLAVIDDGISGKPFLRVDLSGGASRSPDVDLPMPGPDRPEDVRAEVSIPVSGPDNSAGTHQHLFNERSEIDGRALQDEIQDEIQATSRLLSATKASAEVPVGVSRLHTVDLPSLLMKPIYWSPVNDISIVQRATWFYRDTLMPLEPAVANRLESLYRELRPWSETWAIELRCAIEIGPVGEEKVSQPLWPKQMQRGARTKAGGMSPEPDISSVPFCASRCHHGAAAAEGSLEQAVLDGPGRTDAAEMTAGIAAPVVSSVRSFANYQVAFRDDTTAFLLKPSLAPSAYYGRRPIAKISKGATIGIPIVRGFDRGAWEHIHKRGPRESHIRKRHMLDAAFGDGVSDNPALLECPGCNADTEACQISDLVLVIHGVGQKLAERVQSFHFTHAVNGLRRAMNVELKKPVVQSVLREDLAGIMVLPINWRHTLSFEEGGFAEDPSQTSMPIPADSFGLKDIEPASIPAVRSMISDVMFDIPFYMSHHKPKMIQSLVREANRIYRLWCQNNPGFAESGRVHLIGHSLGSAMAIEVLSKQLTTLGPVDLIPAAPQTSQFDFDTKNLFLLGSPSAFFLLLERGALLPRRGRQKPGVDAHDSCDSLVVGDTGTFGCLAVDNIFNILAKEDPIAYLLNGTIDTSYAAGLRTAYVPSAAVGFLASIGHSLRGVVPGTGAMPYPADAPLIQPATPAPIMRLPSQLELEIHDFTREEIAERKAFLLNDNGQIDYFLQSGGGPLEIQYFNMLSAHTSYWTNLDLVRMLCVEIGRRPGKAHTLPAMRAVKKLKRVIPNAAQA